jgi:hypothetical protein
LFSRPRKVHSGKNRSRSPSKASGAARLASHQSSASAATFRKTSPGEGVVARMQRRQLAQQLEHLGIPGQPAEQDLAGGGCVLGRGPLLCRHTPTVKQAY